MHQFFTVVLSMVMAQHIVGDQQVHVYLNLTILLLLCHDKRKKKSIKGKKDKLFLQLLNF